MKINSITFGSAYRITLDDNNKQLTLNSLEELNDIPTDKETVRLLSYDENYNLYRSIIVNDKYDEQIETFLTNNGVYFTKTPTADLFSEQGVKKRIRIPSYTGSGYLPFLVNVKTKEFDKVFSQNPFEQYLGSYETMSQPERYDGFKKYLKTNEPIDASIVFIREESGKPLVDFLDGRHRYAVMRDMGFSSIPVIMKEDSRAVAEKFGLIE